MQAHKVVAIGDVNGTDGDSVYVGFDVTPDQRTALATTISEEIDLEAVPEYKKIGTAYKLDNDDVAVLVPDTSVWEWGY